MQLIVEPFENVTQKEINEKHGSFFWRSAIEYNGGSLGAVDAMMKKDLKSIVAAYKNIVKKRGATYFKTGECQIEIEAKGELVAVVIGKIID